MDWPTRPVFSLKVKSMGKYGSMDEAKKAMASMKECG
jgi:hypothetical protein